MRLARPVTSRCLQVAERLGQPPVRVGPVTASRRRVGPPRRPYAPGPSMAASTLPMRSATSSRWRGCGRGRRGTSARARQTEARVEVLDLVSEDRTRAGSGVSRSRRTARRAEQVVAGDEHAALGWKKQTWRACGCRAPATPEVGLDLVPSRADGRARRSGRCRSRRSAARLAAASIAAGGTPLCSATSSRRSSRLSGAEAAWVMCCGWDASQLHPRDR